LMAFEKHVWQVRASKFYMGTGCEKGVDWLSLKATMGRLKNRGEFLLAGAMNMVAQGALWPNTRRIEAGYPGKEDCPYCGVKETLLHQLWSCKRHRSSEVKAVKVTQGLVEEAEDSSCTAYWLRGLLPAALTTGVIAEYVGEQAECKPTLSRAFPPSGRLTLAAGAFAGTDGSGGEFSSDQRLRRCGASLVIAFSSSLPWPTATIIGGVAGAQTGNRAELTAIWWLALYTDGDITVVVDSSYVVRGVQRGRLFVHATNHDLWSDYWKAAAARVGAILVKKVKSHCTPNDVAVGKISWSDYIVNGMADHLAGVAAEQAALPRWLVEQVRATDQQVYLIRSRLAAIAQQEAVARAPCPARARKPLVVRLTGQGLRGRLLALSQVQGHRLQVVKGTASCKACGRRSKLRAALGWAGEACVQHRAVAAGAHSSHRLRYCKGLLYCSCCGSWAKGRLVKLARACQGAAPKPSAGSSALMAIAAGRKPQGLPAWPFDV
jgi:ribonuclease HI